MKKSPLAVIALCLAAAGCATPEASTEPAVSRGEARTGSNIPRKNQGGVDRVDVIKAEDLERGRAGAPGMPASR